MRRKDKRAGPEGMRGYLIALHPAMKLAAASKSKSYDEPLGVGTPRSLLAGFSAELKLISGGNR